MKNHQMSEKINPSQAINLDKIYPYALVGILVLALSLRLMGLNKGIWPDDYASIYMFSQKSLWQTLQELRTDTHPPLYFIVLHFWSQINNSDAFLRLPSIFFNIATVLIVMMWIKQYSRLASILAGFCFATSPIMLRYSHEIRGYSLLVFATALTFFFAACVITKPDKIFGYIGLALSLIIAVSTHMIGVMLFAPVGIFIVLMTKRDEKKIHWLKILTTIAIPCLIFVFFYNFFLNSDNAQSKISWLPSVSFDSVSFTTNYTLGGYSTLYYPPFFDHLMTFLIFGILATLIILGKWKQNFPFLVAAIIYWLQIIIYSLFKTPILWYTTTLPVIVPLFGFAMLQIATIRKKKIQTAFIAGVTILSLLFTGLWVMNEAWKPLEEFKQASEFVESKWQSNNLIILYPNSEAIIKYYWSNLPSEAVIAVSSATDIEKISSALDAQRKPQTLFLITRIDLGTEKQIETYQKIFSLIESKTSKPLTMKIFFIISYGFKKLDKDNKTINQLLAVQKSKFGEPLSYQDEGTYLSLEYKLRD